LNLSALCFSNKQDPNAVNSRDVPTTALQPHKGETDVPREAEAAEVSNEPRIIGCKIAVVGHTTKQMMEHGRLFSVHAVFKKGVRQLKFQYSDFTLVLTFQPWDMIFEITLTIVHHLYSYVCPKLNGSGQEQHKLKEVVLGTTRACSHFSL